MLVFSASALALAWQTPPAARMDAPPVKLKETWELAYDVAITPFIEDYKRCLNYGNRVITDAADFELQHRSDIPRCVKVYEKSIAASNRMMERRGRADVFTPEDVKEAFDTIGYIHVQRGRFIDDRFEQRRAVLARYEAQYEAKHGRQTAPLNNKTISELEEEAPANAEN